MKCEKCGAPAERLRVGGKWVYEHYCRPCVEAWEVSTRYATPEDLEEGRFQEDNPGVPVPR